MSTNVYMENEMLVNPKIYKWESFALYLSVDKCISGLGSKQDG